MQARSNHSWIAELSSPGPLQQAALGELRGTLLRGLQRAFAGSPELREGLLEDAAQEALVRILDRLSSFEGRSRFTTWATSIAVRLAMSELRRRRWKDVSLDGLIAGKSFEPPRQDGPAEAGPQRRALVGKMYEIIRRDLTEKQRRVLLAELKGMPQAEIARQLGSNRNALYKLTHDARKRLKHGLSEAGYGVEDIHAAFSS